jgi:hypothetical protein
MKAILPIIITIITSSLPLFGQLNVSIHLKDGSSIITKIDKHYWTQDGQIKPLNSPLIDLHSINEIDFGHSLYKVLHFPMNKGESNVDDFNNPLLVEVLIKGTVDLYAYRKKENLIQYFILKEGKIALLEREEYQKDNQVYEKKPFLGVLILYLRDCPTISINEINSTRFDSKALKKLISKYNKNCGEINFTSTRKPIEIVLFPSIGYEYHSAKFSQNRDFRHVSAFRNYEDGLQFNYPTIGAGIQIGVLSKPNIYITSGFKINGSVSFTDSSTTFQKVPYYDSIYRRRNFDVSYNSIQAGLGTYHVFENGVGIILEYLVDFRSLHKVIQNRTHVRRQKRPIWDIEYFSIVTREEYLAKSNLNQLIKIGSSWKGINLLFYYQFGEGGFTNSKGETSNFLGCELRYRIPIRF